jgi:hypothetical protein
MEHGHCCCLRRIRDDHLSELIQPDSAQTQKFATDSDELRSAIFYVDEKTNQGATWITLHLLDTGDILPISERSEFTLGRLSENQPIEPDIDLTPFKAFDNGVSRLHAVIRRNQGNAVLVDLGSSNGTYVNGLRIMPNIEQPLRHGDIVALGKLKMQIVLS